MLRQLLGEAGAPPAQELAVEQLAILAHGGLRNVIPTLPFPALSSARGDRRVRVLLRDRTAERGSSLGARALPAMLWALADLLLPPVCIACRIRIGGHGLLCGACWARIDFIAPP